MFMQLHLEDRHKVTETWEYELNLLIFLLKMMNFGVRNISHIFPIDCEWLAYGRIIRFIL